MLDQEVSHREMLKVDFNHKWSDNRYGTCAFYFKTKDI